MAVGGARCNRARHAIARPPVTERSPRFGHRIDATARAQQSTLSQRLSYSASAGSARSGDNAISFAVDTNYLAWDTNFLGVTICEKENSEVIQKMRPPYENETVRDKDLDEVYKEVIFFKFGGIWVATQCFDLNGNFQPQSRCPRDGLRELAYSHRRSCKETLTACTWNGVPFPCCEHFLPVETEIGLCYAFNSIHTERSVSVLNTASNRATGPATLYFEVLAQSMMYVLPRQEVPTRNTNERHMQLVTPGSFYRLLVSIKEVENDPEVAHTSTAQRGCRLQSQGLPAYPKYSFSGCQVQCRADAQRHLCGCVSPLTPRAGPKDVCNLTGLQCLTKNEPRLMFIKSADDVAGAGLACNCAHGCDDQEINHILSESYVENFSSAPVYVVLHNLPTVRFRRNVVRTKLDLVVSMGGTCGLLVGASLLSFVELVYFFTLRAWGLRAAPAPTPRALHVSAFEHV
ncbi:Sodium channel protein Nach [Gryllus bimaculatus]|nr:Sodium channel protein Nach [Gryllus bimaculatus]